MKWSWRIARVSGIDVYLHGTFLILLAWVALSHLLQGHGATDAMAGLLFVSTLFGIAVLHELGHAITAQRFGIRTRDITCCLSAEWRGWNGCPRSRGKSCSSRWRDRRSTSCWPHSCSSCSCRSRGRGRCMTSRWWAGTSSRSSCG
jgi:hypothetical protein